MFNISTDKQDVKLQMQRNYEEQLEKVRNSAAMQSFVPATASTIQSSKLVEQIQQRKLLFSKKVFFEFRTLFATHVNMTTCPQRNNTI